LAPAPCPRAVDHLDVARVELEHPLAQVEAERHL
jgi:hypothetical protein